MVILFQTDSRKKSSSSFQVINMLPVFTALYVDQYPCTHSSKYTTSGSHRDTISFSSRSSALLPDTILNPATTPSLPSSRSHRASQAKHHTTIDWVLIRNTWASPSCPKSTISFSSRSDTVLTSNHTIISSLCTVTV